MEKFAFIIHPLQARRDVARKYPVARFIPEPALEWYMKRRGPILAAHLTGIRSPTGAEAEGWFIGCPLTPRLFLSMPLDEVYARLEACGHMAEELGAGIVGLGAFTSVVGDGGITLAKRLSIPVTTGNSYTVATAIEGTREAAQIMGISVPEATVAVVGATGSIGATCAEIMAREAREIVLVGRNTQKLQALEERLSARGGTAKISSSISIAEGLKDAQIVITVSSAVEAIIQPEHIRPGAVVCDVARPRDVSASVAAKRRDVLVIEGGVVRVPGDMKCLKPGSTQPFSFGFPPGTAYACMSETMALALDRRYESFTLGKEVSVAQVDEISRICRRHGFTLAGFRSFERAISEDEIRRIRAAAGIAAAS
ncbi:MAG: polysaccharide biosynthesis protein [Chthonomonadales bacterium]